MPLLRRLWSEPLVTFDGEFDRIDRGCINPRPRRPIPVWFGGFGAAASAAPAASATASRSPATSRSIDRHRPAGELLAAEGRDRATFGLELIMTRARSSADVVETAERWAEAGGTHVSILTLKVGLDGHRAHIDHLADVKAAIDARFGT